LAEEAAVIELESADNFPTGNESILIVDDLISLGSLYYEPIWGFYRRDVPINTKRELKGLRIGTSGKGSPTHIIALKVLPLFGISPEKCKFEEIFSPGGVFEEAGEFPSLNLKTSEPMTNLPAGSSSLMRRLLLLRSQLVSRQKPAPKEPRLEQVPVPLPVNRLKQATIKEWSCSLTLKVG
jgi:hypothetical protein